MRKDREERMSEIFDFLREWWGVILIVIVGVLVIVGFVWCFIQVANAPHLQEGEVIAKEYRPAHSVYSPSYIRINGESQIISNYRTEPEKWLVTVQNGEEMDIWYVSESYYNSVKVGDWVTK